ncbi:MAG: hypothetical protein LBU83_10305 [Bacteroidales bacterium]|jgi:hypothetical protein|nr:hypothetical protein [Bacteroidales bacterium]
MHFSKEEKNMWLEDWKESGKSAWSYAKENGLNPRTFIKWTKTESEAKPCFVEVSTHSLMPAPNIPEILIEKGDVKIHIPLMIQSNELRAIMEGLGAVL